LVAVHGRGDLYTENTQAEVWRSNTSKKEVGSKIGLNRGIPVRWVVEGLGTRGILLGEGKPLNRVGADKAAATADEFFIAGFNKWVGADGDLRVEKGEAVAQFSRAVELNPRYVIAYFMLAIAKGQLKDPEGALADYNKAISLNPKYANAYYGRGYLKSEQLKDPEGALADYSKAISLNPKYANAYYGRGYLKSEQLKDPEGALADYNKAISLNPKYVEAYYNRAILKDDKLKDPEGALADYNQSISLNSKYAKAYGNRGLLKQKLNDRQGAIGDLRTAARIFREQGRIEDVQKAISILRQLGATEKP
jgi:tetratricopeptide (TPR) repeat protein